MGKLFEDIWQDTSYGLRTLRRSPGFTFVAVVTLALGIGATTAIFSVVHGVLIRPLPYQDSDQLVHIWATSAKRFRPISVSWKNYEDWDERNGVFDQMIAYRSTSRTWTGGPEPMNLRGAAVVPGFFSLLGVRPARGRAFQPGDMEEGRHRVVILSHGLWQRHFGGDPGVVGQSITLTEYSLTGGSLTLKEASYEIIGVVERGFAWNWNPEIWTPISVAANPWLGSRGARNFKVVARMKPGVTVPQAQTEIDFITQQLEKDYPRTNKGWTAKVVSLKEDIVGSTRNALLLLLAAVGFVLLIACVNVANLLLARSNARQSEFAIRAVIGAARKRLGLQLLTENLLLSCIGGTLGLLLSIWAVRFFVALSPESFPRLAEVGVRSEAFLFTLGVSLLSALLFGLAPMFTATRMDLLPALKEGAGSAPGGKGRTRLRNVLVVSEVALAIILLSGAGLLTRSFLLLVHVNPGFNPDSLLTFGITLPSSRYPTPPERLDGFHNLVQRIESLEGVQSAALVNTIPLSGMSMTYGFTLADRAAPDSQERYSAGWRVVSPRYFSTMEIPVREGRTFTDDDTAASVPVLMINREMKSSLWPDESPLGKRVQITGEESPREIVAVVGNVKQSALDRPDAMEMYLPLAQRPRFFLGSMGFVVRTSGDPSRLIPAVRSQVWSLDKDLPLFSPASMEELLARTVVRPRAYMTLLGVFAVTAILMAAVGLYGVISYSVTQRTHEVGIRVALGAQQGDVLRLLLGQGIALTLVGLMVGLAGALGLTRFLESLLFGVTATDPLTFAAVSVLLFGVSLLACYVPARRATKVDPMVALRHE